jgi:hypothetical protein
MAKIPLNKFRNILINVNATTINDKIYEAPVNRATILINAQVANTTSIEKNISVYISNNNGITLYPLVKDFPIPGYDSRSIISGRTVLQGVDGSTEITIPDRLYVEASEEGLTISLSILETVNKT